MYEAKKKEPKRARKSGRINKREWIIDFRLIGQLKSEAEGIRGVPAPKTFATCGGARALYGSAEEIEVACKEYLMSCQGPKIYKGKFVTDKDGNIVYEQVKPYTLAGLARYIGMTTAMFDKYSRGLYDDLDDARQISEVLIRYRQAVEEYAESRLYDRDGTSGAQFALSRYFKWITQKEAMEIRSMEKRVEQRDRELDMKSKLLEGGLDDDNNIQVTIVRKQKD